MCESVHELHGCDVHPCTDTFSDCRMSQKTKHCSLYYLPVDLSVKFKLLKPVGEAKCRSTVRFKDILEQLILVLSTCWMAKVGAKGSFRWEVFKFLNTFFPERKTYRPALSAWQYPVRFLHALLSRLLRTSSRLFLQYHSENLEVWFFFSYDFLKTLLLLEDGFSSLHCRGNCFAGT